MRPNESYEPRAQYGVGLRRVLGIMLIDVYFLNLINEFWFVGVLQSFVP